MEAPIHALPWLLPPHIPVIVGDRATHWTDYPARTDGGRRGTRTPIYPSDRLLWRTGRSPGALPLSYPPDAAPADIGRPVGLHPARGRVSSAGKFCPGRLAPFVRRPGPPLSQEVGVYVTKARPPLTGATRPAVDFTALATRRHISQQSLNTSSASRAAVVPAVPPPPRARSPATAPARQGHPRSAPRRRGPVGARPAANSSSACRGRRAPSR